jgi:hypothetical protein
MKTLKFKTPYRLHRKTDNRAKVAAEADHAFCSDQEIDWQQYQPFRLDRTPPDNQYIRFTFRTASDGQWRFIVWRGDVNQPATYVCQVQEGGFQGINWPGGVLWYSFQSCENGVWTDWTLSSSDDEGSTDDSLFLSITSLTPAASGYGSVAVIQWAPNLGPPANPNDTPVYTISFQNFQIDNTRSNHVDTNYASLVVNSPLGGVLRTPTKSMGDMNSGPAVGVGLSIPNIVVPQKSSVTIVWSVVNSGHQDQTQLKSAIDTALDAAIQQASQPSEGDNGDSSDGDELLEMAKDLIDAALGFLMADCDGPVVGGRKTISGKDLFNATSPDPLIISLTNVGDDDWGKSPHGCRNSSYTSHITITKTQN